ncbi:unnamed protein product [Clonostachys solani]|uniref:Uncharacterized protein n=1 Tax=Clonostachys solani TaxID=160281 RepID=A0A9N9ZAE3_9HYPO|nr:unnamed protein product [Clonostachys solani]
MIFDPALDDYIDYSLLMSEAEDQKRSNESTDVRVSSRDAIDSPVGSPSTFLESFDVVRDREEDRPASVSPSSFAPSPKHLTVADHTGATDLDLEKSISGRTLSTDDPFAFLFADEHHMFAPRTKDLDPYHFLPSKSQQILPENSAVLRDTAWSDETYVIMSYSIIVLIQILTLH